MCESKHRFRTQKDSTEPKKVSNTNIESLEKIKKPEKINYGEKRVYFGEVSPEAWKKIRETWKSMFKKGKFLCRHEWGYSDDLPPNSIEAIIVYPNGVKREDFETYDYVEKCGKCGAIRGIVDYYP
jgi:hypothetical protein